MPDSTSSPGSAAEQQCHDGAAAALSAQVTRLPRWHCGVKRPLRRVDVGVVAQEARHRPEHLAAAIGDRGCDGAPAGRPTARGDRHDYDVLSYDTIICQPVATVASSLRGISFACSASGARSTAVRRVGPTASWATVTLPRAVSDAASRQVRCGRSRQLSQRAGDLEYSNQHASPWEVSSVAPRAAVLCVLPVAAGGARTRVTYASGPPAYEGVRTTRGVMAAGWAAREGRSKWSTAVVPVIRVAWRVAPYRRGSPTAAHSRQRRRRGHNFARGPEGNRLPVAVPMPGAIACGPLSLEHAISLQSSWVGRTADKFAGGRPSRATWW